MFPNYGRVLIRNKRAKYIQSAIPYVRMVQSSGNIIGAEALKGMVSQGKGPLLFTLV